MGTERQVAATVYDSVTYPGHAFPQTHPDRLALMARLFGMRPADVTACRVLEIGCGDGGNLVPMALGLPGSRFVGIDLAAQPVARARATAGELGLGNVRFEAVGVEDLPEDLGAFDYVISHGVFSWVPPAVRDALLAACGAHLAPQGVAYVSYNAYPGSYVRDMARDMLCFHTSHIEDPAERVGQARALMDLVVLAEGAGPYARVLREHLERLRRHEDWALFHDDLAAVNTPVYFHEFAAHARAHGLQFLAEATLADSRLADIPADVADALERLPDDVVLREQYVDFVRSRMFRQTLLCRDDVRLDRTLGPGSLAGLLVAGDFHDAGSGADGTRLETPSGAAITTPDPLLRRALEILGAFWPQAVPFEDLVTRARRAADTGRTPESDARRLGDALIRVAADALVDLHTVAPAVARRAGERPEVSPLARLQARAGATVVTSVRHAPVALNDPLERELCARLDGATPRSALAGDRHGPQQVDRAIERLVACSLVRA